MLGLIKWLFILKVLKISKTNIFSMVAIWVTLLLSNQVLIDVISITKQENMLNLLYLKWAFICLVLIVSSYLIYRIYCDVLILIGVKQVHPNKAIQAVSKKKSILLKARLKTKSDVIFEKYKSRLEK